MEDRIDYSPSLKHRLKHSICGCFKQSMINQHHPLHHHHLDDSPTNHHHYHHHNHHNSDPRRLTRSSSSGGNVSSARSIRSNSHNDDHFHIKDKCRNLMNKLGTPRGHNHNHNHHHHHHRKSRSTDFRYDPLSYSLNFDEGAADEDIVCIDELPLRNFSARLPPSPKSPRPPPPLTPQPQPPPSLLSPPPRPQQRHASEGAIPQQPPASPSTPSRAPAPREITAVS